MTRPLRELAVAGGVTMGNVSVAPILAGRPDSVTASTGFGLVEDIEALVHGVRSGSWVEAAIGGFAVSMDTLGLVVDPPGNLAAWGVSWLLEHVGPLREALDMLAGDPDQIRAHAQTASRPAGVRPRVLQRFVPGLDGFEVGSYPRVQEERMAVLDYVTANTDRHANNYRTATGDRLVAIDHGYTFPTGTADPIRSSFVTTYLGRELSVEVVDVVRAADPERVRAVLRGSGLGDNAIDGALERLREVQANGRITGESWRGAIADADWNHHRGGAMTEDAHQAPTRVGYYAFLPGSSDEPVRVAEFSWSPQRGVLLTVFHGSASGLARRYYDRGAPYDAQQRLVPRTEGATFMLALVQPSRSSYHHFVDESGQPV